MSKSIYLTVIHNLSHIQSFFVPIWNLNDSLEHDDFQNFVINSEHYSRNNYKKEIHASQIYTFYENCIENYFNDTNFVSNG